MLIGAIIVTGAIVGGAIGGTLASKNTKSNGPTSYGAGPSTITVTLPASSGSLDQGSPVTSSSSGADPFSTSTNIRISESSVVDSRPLPTVV
jgi:hypothetical protein